MIDVRRQVRGEVAFAIKTSITVEPLKKPDVGGQPLSSHAVALDSLDHQWREAIATLEEPCPPEIWPITRRSRTARRSRRSAPDTFDKADDVARCVLGGQYALPRHPARSQPSSSLTEDVGFTVPPRKRNWLDAGNSGTTAIALQHVDLSRVPLYFWSSTLRPVCLRGSGFRGGFHTAGAPLLHLYAECASNERRHGKIDVKLSLLKRSAGCMELYRRQLRFRRMGGRHLDCRVVTLQRAGASLETTGRRSPSRRSPTRSRSASPSSMRRSRSRRSGRSQEF